MHAVIAQINLNWDAVSWPGILVVWGSGSLLICLFTSDAKREADELQEVYMVLGILGAGGVLALLLGGWDKVQWPQLMLLMGAFELFHAIVLLTFDNLTMAGQRLKLVWALACIFAIGLVFAYFGGR